MEMGSDFCNNCGMEVGTIDAGITDMKRGDESSESGSRKNELGSRDQRGKARRNSNGLMLESVEERESSSLPSPAQAPQDVGSDTPKKRG
jgi:hypothetical protein